MNISDFLGGLTGSGKERPRTVVLKCPACGMNYEEFRKKGRLGCDRCYLTFRKQLVPLLKKIHSATRHTGKIPLSIDKKISLATKIKELNARLQRAIELEEFEEAAWLRDEIKKTENQHKK